MAELLLELFSEEIPARMQAAAALDLASLLIAQGAPLDPKRTRSYATPRRLCLVATGLPAMQPDISEEKRGPRVGAPQQAVDGFLKSAGLASLDQCEKRDTGKGEFWFAVIEKKGRPTSEAIQEALEKALAQFPWPKSMRWGSGKETWVRPLQSILCLFDGAVVPARFAGIEASNTTQGHRFLAPQPFAVSDFADYQAKLERAHVLLDPAQRRAKIAEDLNRLAQAEGLAVRPDEGLLDEVAGLVEWPVALLGSIDQAFMDVPPEVLITSMRSHQKYFSLETKDGKLASRFGLIANMQTQDGGKAIVAGNERVLRARLSDAKFFWDQDRKARLEDRLPRLAERVFYKGLGTMLDKAGRLERLASELARWIDKADVAHVACAAKLAKADLSSGMVGEFPELQGIMGRYYAIHAGERAEVAEAIAGHYAPAGPGDRCPSEPASVAVALADKIDSLVGFFAIDEKPTGSKDPFALRRAALGVIRLVVENKLRLPLSEAFKRAWGLYGQNFPSPADKAAGDLLDFFAERLKVHLREKGVRHDLISAVFALGGEDDLVRLLARVDALGAFLKSQDGANLLTAYKRAANILKIEEKKDGPHTGEVQDDRLEAAEETALLKALADTEADVAPLLVAEDFQGVMSRLALLRGPVDAFFDKVTVNASDKELRANRLRLLSRIRAVMDKVADFSKIEG
jgi:glycyl-tRNA synthetase beta chain